MAVEGTCQRKIISSLGVINNIYPLILGLQLYLLYRHNFPRLVILALWKKNLG